jgi:hypothetical protein
MKPETEQQAIERNERYESAFKLLTEKGLTVGERMKVRKAFIEWGESFPRNVETKRQRGSEEQYYISTIPALSGVGFGTEKEAEFFNALYELSPESDKQKLLTVLGIVTKLLGVESDYSFEPKK